MRFLASLFCCHTRLNYTISQPRAARRFIATPSLFHTAHRQTFASLCNTRHFRCLPFQCHAKPLPIITLPCLTLLCHYNARPFNTFANQIIAWRFDAFPLRSIPCFLITIRSYHYSVVTTLHKAKLFHYST